MFYTMIADLSISPCECTSFYFVYLKVLWLDNQNIDSLVRLLLLSLCGVSLYGTYTLNFIFIISLLLSSHSFG